MHKKLFFSLVMVLLALTACTSRPPAPTRVPSARLDPVQPAVSRETDPGSLAATPTPAGPDHCLDCHSDKQRLIDTAGPEEEGGEGESKGVG
jgi:hypothetical protein